MNATCPAHLILLDLITLITDHWYLCGRCILRMMCWHMCCIFRSIQRWRGNSIQAPYGYFQQDSAKAHTEGNSMATTSDVFGERVVSECLWPARSPDHTPWDFYLWGSLKVKVYRKNTTHYMSSKKIFGKKYPAFPQQSCNVLIKTCSCAAVHVYEQKGNIFKALLNRFVSKFVLLFCSLVPGSRKESQSCPEHGSALGGAKTK
jgi:hypothetical protein